LIPYDTFLKKWATQSKSQVRDAYRPFCRLAADAPPRAGDSESSTDSTFTPLGEYCPFIADLPISSFAEPFPIPHPDPRSEEEIEMAKRNFRKIVHLKKFDSPFPLADFCLIVRDRWESDGEESGGSG
jgi:hypothetical protein